eukprot:142514-Prorocentrum_lima.AAC.1
MTSIRDEKGKVVHDPWEVRGLWEAHWKKLLGEETGDKKAEEKDRGEKQEDRREEQTKEEEEDEERKWPEQAELPSLEEIERYLAQLKDGKVGGCDQIHLSTLKAIKEEVAEE